MNVYQEESPQGKGKMVQYATSIIIENLIF